MKRIKITPAEELLPIEQIGPQRGMYRIFIYFDKDYYFPSTRKALRFIAIANQFLTRTMYKSRLIYIDVLNKYHKDWGYFEHDKPSMGSDLYKLERQCLQALNNIQSYFDLITERSHWTNGSCIAYGNMLKICGFLKEAIDYLRQLNAGRNFTMELYLLDKLNDDVLLMERTLKCFGDTEARLLNKPTMHNQGLPASMLETNVQVA